MTVVLAFALLVLFLMWSSTELLTMSSCRKDWKKISAESFLTSPWQPIQSRDWTELKWFSTINNNNKNKTQKKKKKKIGLGFYCCFTVFHCFCFRVLRRREILSAEEKNQLYVLTGHLYLKEDVEKMSKSLKNTVSVSQMLDSYTPNQFRMLCLLTHYRNREHRHSLKWSWLFSLLFNQMLFFLFVSFFCLFLLLKVTGHQLFLWQFQIMFMYFHAFFFWSVLYLR